MNAFTWLLRREVWEHRGFYLAPLILVGLLLLCYITAWVWPGSNVVIDIDGHGANIHDFKEFVFSEPEAQHKFKFAVGALPFVIPTILVNIVILLLWFFYLSGSLYSERRDRSVLFWKSLPVSDTATVMSKFVTAVAVIPLIALAAIVAAALALTVVNTFVVWSAGESAWEYVWSQVPFVSGPTVLAYGFAVQSLWYAPVFAYLLLASAFAPRAPALWAVLPPLGMMLLERLTFGTMHVANFLGERLTPIVQTAFRESDFERLEEAHIDGEIAWSELIRALVDPQSFVSDPRLWGGLVAAAVLLAGAVWLRRERDAF